LSFLDGSLRWTQWLPNDRIARILLRKLVDEKGF